MRVIPPFKNQDVFMNKKGFTLVELIVVMAIFIVVMIAISNIFENIVRGAGQQAKSATTQIEGVVGLEMFRSDISHAGFGLPWTLEVSRTFTEVSAPPVSVGVTIGDFNGSAPLAVAARSRTGGSFEGSHYLVLKSALQALNSATNGRGGFVNYSSEGNSHISVINDSKTDLRAGDRIIHIRSAFSESNTQTKELMMVDASATGFYYALPDDILPDGSYSLSTIDEAFKPANAAQAVLAYAISDGNLKMPYNRADYYIHRDDDTIPRSCNSGTGVLYKAVVAQSGDDYAGTYPLLNCVGDMQVVVGLDDGLGSVAYLPAHSPGVTALTPAVLAARLKEVRVYILAHEGTKDKNYKYPGTSILVGEPGIGGRTWEVSDMEEIFDSDWVNYRWKVYSIAVQMKNLGGA